MYRYRKLFRKRFYQIKVNFQHKHFASRPNTTTEEVEKLLKNEDTKKLQVLKKFPQVSVSW